MRTHRTTRRVRRGISLIEMLIALAITALLLIAVAMAFDASFASYEQNRELADATQAARILSHRITTQARRSSYLNVANSGTRVEMELPDDPYQHIYVYSAAEQQVTLYRMNLGTLVIENLGAVDNVAAFAIPDEQQMENPPRLTLTLTVRAGSNEVTLGASAVPRSTVAF